MKGGYSQSPFSFHAALLQCQEKTTDEQLAVLYGHPAVTVQVLLQVRKSSFYFFIGIRHSDEFWILVDEKVWQIKARRKIFFNADLVCGGVKDNRLLKKLEGSATWELRTEYSGNEYRPFSFWDTRSDTLIVATHGIEKVPKNTTKRDCKSRTNQKPVLQKITDMEAMKQELMLDKYVGNKRIPEREESDAEVRKVLDDYRIGEAIKAERKKQGLTQKQLGERMGVQKAQVSKIENGKSPAYSSILRAFKALGAKTASIDLGDMGRVALW